MPIIYSYPVVNTVQNTDTFVVSVPESTADNGFLTQSVTADTLATFVTARVNLNFLGDTGTGVVNLDTQNLTISGTANEIETAASNQVLQIGLPDNVTITNNLTVGGNNLLIQGTPDDPTLEFSAANYDTAYIQTGPFTAMKVDMQDANYFMMGDLAPGSRSSIYPIRGNMGTDVSLWYLNNIRFQTTNTGVDVFGELDVSDAARIPRMLQTVDMQTNGIINLPNPVNPQDAATKSYVDTAVTGLLEFKGTFRADTGEILSGGSAGAFIYNCPGGAGTRIDVAVGDYYIVATSGGQFYCSGDLLDIGDGVVGVADATGNTSTINDWSILEGDNIEGSGTANYIPKWTDSQVLGDSVIYEDADGHVGVGVVGSPPNPRHKFEVYDLRDENNAFNYSMIVTSDINSPFNQGTGGIKNQLSTDGGLTYPYAISLVTGTTSSELMASTKLAFYANSDLNTSSATGFSGFSVHDGTNPFWQFGGAVGDATPTARIKVVGNSWVGDLHDTNIGVNASVFGQESEASGFASFAANQLGNATGAQSASFNFQTTASGGASASFGAVTTASGNNSFATGDNTVSSGASSFTAGSTNNASGNKSAAFGQGTIASGTNATTFGLNTNALGDNSISAGDNTTAGATNSFVFGINSTSSAGANYSGTFGSTNSNTSQGGFVAGFNNTVGPANNAAAFGSNHNATGDGSFAVGAVQTISGIHGAAFGESNTVSQRNAFAVGKSNTASAEQATAFGEATTASGTHSFAQGQGTTALGIKSFAGGTNSAANNVDTTAIGTGVTANGESSQAFGIGTQSNGLYSFAANTNTQANQTSSFACGELTQANGSFSFAGGVNSQANNQGAVAFGGACLANGEFSFAAGNITIAGGNFSTSFGLDTEASGQGSTALNHLTIASGQDSTAINFNNTASGQSSFAFGNGNTTSGLDSAAGGRSNTVSSENSIAFGFQNNTSTASSGPIGTTSSEQMLFGRNLFPPRDVAGNAVDCQFVVGKHNNDVNQPPTAFVVGTGSSSVFLENSFTVLYDGKVLMEQVVNLNYADDTAAAAAGVPIGGVYHNAGALRIRIT